MSEVITISNRVVSFTNPQPEQFHLDDIAIGLSRAPRFTGQTKTQKYTVLQHTLAVHGMSPDEFKPYSIFHDAAEAYTGDIPGPLKRMVPELKEIDNRLTAAICYKYGIMQQVRLKIYDNIAQYLEVMRLGDIDHVYWKSFKSMMQQYDIDSHIHKRYDMYLDYDEYELVSKFLALANKYRTDKDG